MSLLKMEARNSAGSLLSLPFQDASGGYILKEVGGLDPVKATIVSSSYANQDGEEYESSRRGARNILPKIEFAPDWVSSNPKMLRDNLYKWFMPKMQCELRFYEDTGLVVSIVGRTESNDASRFTQTPGSDISFIAFKPDFIGMTNEHVTANSVSDATEATVNYVGTSETGFLFTMNVNRTIGGFAFYMRGADGIQYELDFTADLLAGDVVKISTVQGNKFATLTRGGVDTSLLYAISPSSPWLTLQPGANKIRVQIAGAAIPYTLDYTDKYGAL